MKPENQCVEQVHNSFGVNFHRCPRKGKVSREGKWYCGQHDPEAVEKRRAASAAKWKEEQSLQRAQRAAADLQRAKADAFDWLAEKDADGRGKRQAFYTQYEPYEWRVVDYRVLRIEGWCGETLLEAVQSAMKGKP